MRSTTSDYIIRIFRDTRKVLEFEITYLLEKNQHKNEIRLILKELARNRLEDGEYKLYVLLRTSTSSTTKRIYNIKLTSRPVKTLEYDLVKTQSKPVISGMICGKEQLAPTYPIFIPDYTVYDIKQF